MTNPLVGHTDLSITLDTIWLQVAVDAFQREICGYVDEELVKPLCRDIENDLRLHIHTGVVRLDDRNPFKVGTTSSSFFSAFALFPFSALT